MNELKKRFKGEVLMNEPKSMELSTENLESNESNQNKSFPNENLAYRNLQLVNILKQF